MKKFLLRAFTLVAVVGGMNSTFAEEAASKNADTPKFDPILRVRGRAALFDSTRKTNFDFFDQDIRLGARYSQSLFTAVAEAEFTGNSLGTSPDVGQGVSVRKAYVGLNVFQNDNSKIDVMVGRFIPIGANTYGNEAITGHFSISGFLPEDGGLAQYTGDFKGIRLKAQAAIASALPIWLFNGDAVPGTAGLTSSFSMSGSSSYFYGGSSFGSGSNTDTKAYLGNVSVNADVGPGKLEAVVAYAHQANDVLTASSTATGSACTVSGSAITCATTASTARNVDYVEASVGYGMDDNLKYGLWFSKADLGETKTNAEPNGGAKTFGNGNGLSDQFSIAGIGVQANSKLIGMTNLLQKDDMLTAGAGVQIFMHRQTGTSAISDSNAAKNDVTQLSVGTGYAKGAFSTELNYSRFMASNSVFQNQGQNNYVASADHVYLVVAVSL